MALLVLGRALASEDSSRADGRHFIVLAELTQRSSTLAGDMDERHGGKDLQSDMFITADES